MKAAIKSSIQFIAISAIALAAAFAVTNAANAGRGETAISSDVMSFQQGI